MSCKRSSESCVWGVDRSGAGPACGVLTEAGGQASSACGVLMEAVKRVLRVGFDGSGAGPQWWRAGQYYEDTTVVITPGRKESMKAKVWAGWTSTGVNPWSSPPLFAKSRVRVRG
eukprot:354194-Chlamydomonas_euryale.AAC.1